MPTPSETSIPIYSALTFRMARAHFHDAWCITVPATDRSACELLADLVSHTPDWVERSLRLRNRVARRLQLKPLGTMADLARLPKHTSWAEVDEHAPFVLVEPNGDEVLLRGQDQHLSMFFSVHRQLLPDGQSLVLTISSLVQAHNRLGHWYLRAIEPVHRRIVPAMLARLGQGPVTHLPPAAARPAAPPEAPSDPPTSA